MPVKTLFGIFVIFFTSRKTFSRTLFSVFFTPTYFFHGHSFVFLFFTGKKNGLTGRNFFFPRVGIFLVKRKFLSPKRQNSFFYPLWNWIQWYISQNEWSFFTHNFKLSRAHFVKFFTGTNFSFTDGISHKISRALFFSRTLFLIFFRDGSTSQIETLWNFVKLCETLNWNFNETYCYLKNLEIFDH